MGNRDRLSGLDSSFLHFERGATQMHVATCALLEGPAPGYDELVEEIVARLHLVPRYRQRLASVPLGQGRPVWVDDPHFNARFHIRHTALPRPGGDEELKRLVGRVCSQSLDRSKPLWELWLVEGLAQRRFVLLFKTHSALVDGVSNVDLATVLFNSSAQRSPVAAPERGWIPRPLPSDAQLLADALLERATEPGEVVRGLRALVRGPRDLAGRIGGALLARAGVGAAPASPFNVRIGPHRRFTYMNAELEDFGAIGNSLGATVNDVVLAVLADALGRYMRLHGHPTEGVVLTAIVPVSVGAQLARGSSGHELAAAPALLPVGLSDPVQRLLELRAQMRGIKDSGEAVEAQLPTRPEGFAPPTALAAAVRLHTNRRRFSLVVANVPGPQQPYYLLGRELLAIYPIVPLADHTAFAFAVISYNGRLNFGLSADYDTLPDLETLAGELRSAIDELSAAAARAGASPPPSQPRLASAANPRLRAVRAE